MSIASARSLETRTRAFTSLVLGICHYSICSAFVSVILPQVFALVSGSRIKRFDSSCLYT